MSGYLAIVDWGIGGLGLYAHLKKRANVPVLYFSDSGHAPYGKTARRELNRRLAAIFDFLFSQGASHIAIACNAASAAYEDTDTINGIIGHGVSAVKSGGWRNVGLLAGRGTVNSRIYARRLKGTPVALRQRVSQPLSAHVEAGRLDGAELNADLRRIMAPLRRCQAVLLACTHYPAIAGQIARHAAPGCVMIDPAGRMADWILNTWDLPADDRPGRWYTTGNPDQLMTSGKRAFGVAISGVERAPALS